MFFFCTVISEKKKVSISDITYAETDLSWIGSDTFSRALVLSPGLQGDLVVGGNKKMMYPESNVKSEQLSESLLQE